jgi:hypothetical protein
MSTWCWASVDARMASWISRAAADGQPARSCSSAPWRAWSALRPAAMTTQDGESQARSGCLRGCPRECPGTVRWERQACRGGMRTCWTGDGVRVKWPLDGRDCFIGKHSLKSCRWNRLPHIRYWEGSAGSVLGQQDWKSHYQAQNATRWKKCSQVFDECCMLTRSTV